MSRFRERCAELRARVLLEGNVRSVSDQREMPAKCNLQNHIKGQCCCDSDLPALEYIGRGAGGHWRFEEAPPCPTCENSVMVDRTGNQHTRYIRCHGCGYKASRGTYLNDWLRSKGVRPSSASVEVDA